MPENIVKTINIRVASFLHLSPFHFISFHFITSTTELSSSLSLRRSFFIPSLAALVFIELPSLFCLPLLYPPLIFLPDFLPHKLAYRMIKCRKLGALRCRCAEMQIKRAKWAMRNRWNQNEEMCTWLWLNKRPKDFDELSNESWGFLKTFSELR